MMGTWRRLLLAMVGGVAVASIYTAQPVLEPMGHDLGIPTEHTGWIVATAQIGYLAGLILLMPLGDILDRRKLIATHLALTAAGMILTAAANTAWMALTGLATAGIFAVVVQATVAYAATVSAPDERGKNIAAVVSGVVIGILGGRILAGALTDIWGWRSTYLVLATLALALTALVLAALPTDHRHRPPARYTQALAALGGLFRQRLFLTRGLIAFFLFASFATLWSGIALPLAAAPWHLTESQIGLIGIAGLAGALGAGRAGRWADAGHAHTTTGIALILLIASWAGIAQLPRSLWPLAAGVLLLDFAVQLAHVSNQHLLATAHPDRTSTAIGGYMIFYSLGSALGAATTTAVHTTAGWTAASLLGTAFAACGLATWAIDRRLPAPSAPAEHTSAR
ncbi:MFS transporter [Saccharopolyspora antimicrobica]